MSDSAVPQQPVPQDGGGHGQQPPPYPGVPTRQPRKQTGPRWLPLAAGTIVGAFGLIAAIIGAATAGSSAGTADPAQVTSTSASAGAAAAPTSTKCGTTDTVIQRHLRHSRGPI
ncbi:hypothetical protein GCM10022236_53170 [Microlunatus ginsengisoli]|uniref:Uncharacterized protein n=1 Tax=Microlunatus ginsengisoli TaxID=363863 RepID=A0ABP7B0E0_9ACTN